MRLGSQIRCGPPADRPIDSAYLDGTSVSTGNDLQPLHAGRPVAGCQERSGPTAPAHVLEELLTARGILLGPRRQVQQHLLAVCQDPPGRQHRFARLAQMQALGDTFDKQVGDLELRGIIEWE